MQVPRNWNDETELFELIYQAIEERFEEEDHNPAKPRVWGSDEQSNHGEDGHIEIRFSGRRFSLALREIF